MKEGLILNERRIQRLKEEELKLYERWIEIE